MPFLDAKRCTPKTRRLCQLHPGFSLIEIMLSLFMILAIVSVVLVIASTYMHSRRTSLQSIATGIVTKYIESQRQTAFASIPINTAPFTDPELSLLPSGAGQRTVAIFNGNNNIKQMTVWVSWTENNAPRQIKVDTLISANGI